MIKYNNLFLVGPMGAGKSSIGKLLANKLNMDFFDSDIELERRAGASISWIFDVEGEQGMRDREIKVISALSAMKNIVLATGGGSILAPENRSALASRGTVIYLKATIDQQVNRTTHNRDNRPLLQVDDLRSKIEELAKIRSPLYEEIADYTIATEEGSTTDVINKILEKIT